MRRTTAVDAGALRASTGGLSARRLHMVCEAFCAEHHEEWQSYAFLQVGDSATAHGLVGELKGRLTLHWEHALRQESVEGHSWKIFKEIIFEWLDERGLEPALVRIAAPAKVCETILGTCGPPAPGAERTGVDQPQPQPRPGLYAAIAALPERQYDVLLLRYVLEYDQARTAFLMGVPQETVRSHIRHAKRRLALDLGLEWAPGPGE
ncbi:MULTISPECIES: sigma factor-like helix-turn-helix DNA-binding protein [unclassified Streptomyces]|uniref:sigma factor-like helix-turn-helix DNA-binding protein n=1 Tax=unclassified Streptomyces TaxID=2593676 RepID=UPI002E1E9D98|nr:RNA polymerase sigma factor [Streptomyces sp. NBC_01023]